MAYYYFGTCNGTGKKSGKPWWGVSILRYVPNYGSWMLKAVFCSEKFKQQVDEEQRRGRFVIGGPVIMSVNIDGFLTSLDPDDSVDPLDLIQ